MRSELEVVVGLNILKISRIEVEMKDKIIKGLIRGTCLSVFYLIFDYISRNWGLVETRQFLYILIMILYLWKDN